MNHICIYIYIYVNIWCALINDVALHVRWKPWIVCIRHVEPKDVGLRWMSYIAVELQTNIETAFTEQV